MTDVHDHDAFREHLALALYGELDDDEAVRLAAHLATCDACRRDAARLQDGLGALVAADGGGGAAGAGAAAGGGAAEGAGPDLPDGWREALEARLAAGPASSARRLGAVRRAGAWLPAAAGFAAGVLVVLALTGGGAGTDRGGEPVRGQPEHGRGSAPSSGAFYASEPPPPALRRGPRLGLFGLLEH